MRTLTAAVSCQLLKTKRIRGPNVLHAMQRCVGQNQYLTSGPDSGDNLCTVRQPLTTCGIYRAFCKSAYIFLIREPHKHWVLRGRVSNGCLSAKTHQMP